VDATKCLGQTVDVILCRNDSGCSGGADGKVTLSKKSFTIKGKSEEIEVYGPSIPGTYGITVHARTRGSTGFNYIGEMPVTFIEPENRTFKLNKYELMLQGQNAEDVILLENHMLTQSVKVKADGCVWGEKNPGTDWTKVLTGTMLGATIGSLIGTGFKSPHPEDKGKTPGTKTADSTNNKAQPTDSTSKSSTTTTTDTSKGGFWSGVWDSVSGGVSSAWDSTGGALWDYFTGPDTTTSSYGEDIDVYGQNGGSGVDSASTWVSDTDDLGSNQTTSSGTPATTWDDSTGSTGLNQTAGTGTPAATVDDTYEPTSGVAPLPETNQKAKQASFSVWAGHQQGWFALVGAVVGALVAYLDQDFDCSDSKYDDTIAYTDYVINLEGGTTSVTNADGTETIEQEIPSDAGDVSFSLGEITPEWDFTDAYYSGTETVAVRFTNTGGLDEQMPKYGTLTVNATRHIHGYDPAAVASGASSGSSADYDVECTEQSFGNYWIGSGSDEGSCSGVSEQAYSQKFHIRIISSDPKGEDAYVRKYSSCYMGSMTGSTGADALPKIKLSWDWDAIDARACDYGNPNYIYCDGTQFMIALTKKLAKLDEFLMANGGSMSCPPSPTEDEVQSSIDSINETSNTVMDGTIGITKIDVTVLNNKATAVLTINNLSGAAQETMLSYAWKGEGKAESQIEQFTAAAGQSTMTLESGVDKYEGIYYFSAVVNGEKGDRISVTRAFTNLDVNNQCWVEQSTSRTAGVPSLIYYVDGQESVTYTSSITDISDLYNTINFAVYLTRDSFTEDFFADFKEFYRQKFMQKVNANATESEIVDYLTSGNFKITKRFTGDNTVEPGLYEVYVNIVSPDKFRVIDGNNTKVEIQLLLIKTPSVDSPFYRMPIDGMLGTKGNGRQGYGSTYKNIDADAGGILISNDEFLVNTFDSAMSNGTTSVETTTKTNFEEVNVAPGTRGQIASISVSNNSASLKLAPTYATPLIGKITIDDVQEGKMAYNLSTENKSIITGGNLAYWTGAAKTKNFYGGNAIDTFQDSADHRLTKLGDNVYGFEFDDISNNGTMLLKSLFFIPADSAIYMLQANESSATFWTPSSEFAPNVQLGGIGGMTYNDQGGNSKISSLQNLFDAVTEGKVCVSNDGSSTSFWWNPAVIETVEGSNSSMVKKELELIGTK
jgi:hypothetical protein